MKCAQFCSQICHCFSQTSARCAQGHAEPRNSAMAKVHCKAWNWLTTDLHPIASMCLGELSHFFMSSWTCCSAPCLQFSSHPLCFPPLHNSWSPPVSFSAPNLLDSTSCGWLECACMPAGQLTCTCGCIRGGPIQSEQRVSSGCIPLRNRCSSGSCFSMWTNGSIKHSGTEHLWALCCSAESDSNWWIALQNS